MNILLSNNISHLILPISEAKAQELLDEEISKYVDKVNALPFPAGCKLSQSQFDVLISLVFNCGEGVLETKDVRAMIKLPRIYPGFRGPMASTESETLDFCSKLVSRAFSYDTNLKPRRNREAELFCIGRKYNHKYPVYTL